MQRLKLLLRFLGWFWKAKTKYQVHSPFVFEFINEILEDKRQYYAFGYIEKLRKLMLHDHRTITVNDFGAGSHIEKQKQRKISAIAKTSLTSKKYCQVLFKMVNFYQSMQIVEMGTSLGISALYLAHANKKAQVHTFEGCPIIAGIAAQNFKQLKTQNIKILSGEFGTTLPSFLRQAPSLDFIFIDGNHRYQPTLDYYESFLKKSHNDTVFIFDDIYWSDEMVAAWEAIKRHDSTRISIDLFFMGIVFIRSEQGKKEHFKLVPHGWKPWILGFLK